MGYVNNKIIRKSYLCSEETNKLIKQYAYELGMSESSFVNHCILNYHQQQVAIKSFIKIDEVVSRLEKLEQKVVKNK